MYLQANQKKYIDSLFNYAICQVLKRKFAIFYLSNDTCTRTPHALIEIETWKQN